MSKKKIIIAAIILIVSIVLALATAIYRSQKAFRCDYDGTRIIPIYEVDIMLKEGKFMRFCSIYCARAWFQGNASRVDAVLVTDEITGEKLDADIAFFVESDVVTVKATQNRIHVFKDKTHALSHARQYNGKLVDNPFKLANARIQRYPQ